jgi:cytochrome P450
MVFYNPADPQWSLQPGPLFDEIREKAPVHQTPDNYWVLSRHEDVLGLLRSPFASSDSMNVHPDKQPHDFSSSRRDEQRALIRETGDDTRPFLFRDPPDHARLRGLVQRAFTPKRVAELEPFVRSTTKTLLEGKINGEPFDVVQDLAWALPVAVICEMLNIPPEDQETFQRQSALLARGLDPEFLLSPEDRVERDNAVLHFGAYFHDLFSKRRAAPGDDLLSALVAARDGGDQLSEGELLSTAVLLLVAGHETTMNLISGSFLALSRDRDAQASLRKAGSIDRHCVDELLRFVSPVQITGRSLLSDMNFGGHTIEEGSFVLALIGAANRDPAVFEAPTTLTLSREPNPQLGFGFGLHHCLGAPLARLESQVVLEEVLKSSSSFDVVGPVKYRPNIVLRGLEELSLVIEP